MKLYKYVHNFGNFLLISFQTPLHCPKRTFPLAEGLKDFPWHATDPRQASKRTERRTVTCRNATSWNWVWMRSQWKAAQGDHPPPNHPTNHPTTHWAPTLLNGMCGSRSLSLSLLHLAAESWASCSGIRRADDIARQSHPRTPTQFLRAHAQPRPLMQVHQGALHECIICCSTGGTLIGGIFPANHAPSKVRNGMSLNCRWRISLHCVGVLAYLLPHPVFLGGFKGGAVIPWGVDRWVRLLLPAPR